MDFEEGNDKKSISERAVFGIIGAVLGIIVGAGSVTFGATSYVQAEVNQQVQPVQAQISALQQSSRNETALLIVIAEKDGIPHDEVNQLLSNTN